ncbi:hypothetical protein OsJ_35585 [Oryza sativa Japonica Group]|uniref:Uncharacterized protein n=1 Tax=Oryza sativa subsp. japonica TaxID=39947 RepID=A3CFX8_ORYSJ|nr:hypothetical protein OsJ_35585 [Oryza sativa Japonica Group]
MAAGGAAPLRITGGRQLVVLLLLLTTTLFVFDAAHDRHGLRREGLSGRHRRHTPTVSSLTHLLAQMEYHHARRVPNKPVGDRSAVSAI